MKAANQIRQSVKHWQNKAENLNRGHPVSLKVKPNEAATLKSTGVASENVCVGCLRCSMVGFVYLGMFSYRCNVCW